MKFLKTLFMLLFVPSVCFGSVVLESANTEYLNLASGALCTDYPLSISVWIKANNVDVDMSAVFIGHNGSTNNALAHLFSDGSAASDFYTAQVRDATTNAVANNGSITTGAWLHMGGVFASTTSRTVYPNGGAKEENTQTVNPANENVTQIGRRGSSATDQYWDGKIAEVAIWCGTALTDGNMTSLAAGDNPMTIGAPTAYWSFISDATDGANTNDLTAVGGGITYDGGDHPDVDEAPGEEPEPSDFPTTMLLDDFNRANQSPITGIWTSGTMGDGNCRVATNQLVKFGGGFPSCHVAQAYGDQQEAWVQFPNITGWAVNTANMILFCMQQAGIGGAGVDGYGLEYKKRDAPTADQIEFFRWDNRVATQISATFDQDLANGDYLGVSTASDGTFTAWFKDGAGAWESLGTVNDTTYDCATTHIGAALFVTDNVFDNFGGGNVVVPATGTGNPLIWLMLSR